MITALPTPPARTDPIHFQIRSTAFLGALPTFATQLNADAVQMDIKKLFCQTTENAILNNFITITTNCSTARNAPGTPATSSSSLTIGTGSKSLILDQVKEFAIGQYVLLQDQINTSNTMKGQITAFTSGTGSMTVNSLNTTGSGTSGSWKVSVTSTSTGIVSLNGLTGAVDEVARLSDTQTIKHKTITGSNFFLGSSANNCQFNSLCTFTSMAASSLVITNTVISNSEFRKTIVRVTASQSVSSGTIVCYDSNLNLTLPASPVIGSQITFKSLGYYPTTTILRNGQPIMSANSDLVLDTLYAKVTLCYMDATRGWIITP